MTTAADQIVSAVIDGGLVRLNEELLVHGLRVSIVPSRHPVTQVMVSEVLSLLRQPGMSKYRELRVMADDMREESVCDATNTVVAWTCERGIYRFAQPVEPTVPPTREQHRDFVVAARRQRNDPDGITVNRPPYAIFVGEFPFIFVMCRAALADWTAADDPFLRCMKEMLLPDLKRWPL